MKMTRARGLKPRNSEAGFTLVELMISLTILSVAVAAAFTLAFSLMNGFRDHKQSINVESSSRTILDMMASGVRAASPGITSGEAWDPCTGGLVDTIEVTNETTEADQLRVVHALGGAFASMTSAQDISGGTITVDDNTLFEPELWTPAIIVEPQTSAAHLVEVFASASDATEFRVRQPGGSCGANWGDPNYDAASFVVRAVHVHYFVDPPFLMVDPDGPGDLGAEIMAEGVEDLQIAIGVENGTDTDSLTETVLKTDDEWHFNDVGDTAPGSITAGGWRALRITIVGIANRETRLSGNNLRPAVEDRAAATVTDPYRRRTYSTTVQLRNFENAQ